MTTATPTRRAFVALAALAGLAAFTASTSTSYANTPRSAASRPIAKARIATRPQTAAVSTPSRLDVPVAAVQGSAPGQAGYVHYFVITGPDGDAINHVAIELPGDRVAHSFPDDGVSIVPFVKNGAMTTSAGNVYQIEHLYGVRPFGDEAAMRVLQHELASRIQPWLDAKTPYCDELSPRRSSA